MPDQGHVPKRKLTVIQGVIIVGQGEETDGARLEEYVVTRELQRHFADFFAAYKKYSGTTPKMGVWISGFFGSGVKSFPENSVLSASE